MNALKTTAHAVSITAGRLTGGARMLPSFLIVGAQRCGTTSLYRALSQHPQVAKPVLRKGVHYFDMAYGRSLSWYRAHFPLRRTGMLAFESSPYYLFHPLAGLRIAWDLPDVKIVVLVRDPVERAISAHAHELARGFESEPSFARAVELEPERLAGENARLCAAPLSSSHAHRHHAYLARGRYAEQLARLDPIIARDRIKVIDSGRFFTDPLPVYADLLDFLGLPPAADPVFDRHNARTHAEIDPALRTRLSNDFLPWDALLLPWLDATPSWRA
ncbi:hypothetical protein HerbRD11066_43440 [Herbidospora sp. RD11066]